MMETQAGIKFYLVIADKAKWAAEWRCKLHEVNEAIRANAKCLTETTRFVSNAFLALAATLKPFANTPDT